MAVIYRNVGGAFTMLSSATTSTADDVFVADSFSFGVEREMKESGEKGGTEDTANLLSFTKVMLRQDTAPYGSDIDVDDLLVNAVITEGSEDTSGRQLDSFIIEFDRPVDPAVPMGEDWTLIVVTDHGQGSGGGRDLFIGGDGLDTEPYNGDGRVDAYVVWRKNDGTQTGIDDTDLSLSAVETGGIPATLPEYAVMIEFI